jgi:hypothetical protein
VAQAWRADRIPHFSQGADTNSVALFTEVTVGVDSRGDIVKLEWLGYTVEKGNVRIPVLVVEHLLQHTSYVRPTNPEGLMMTDASEHGWGAILRFKKAFYLTYGSFSMEVVSASSNRKETTAVLNGLVYWKDILQGLAGQALAIRTDNMITVFNL